MNPCKCGCGLLVEGNYKRGHARRGRKNSAEHNARISQANSGRKLSPEQIAILRRVNTGRKQTEETRRKRSATARAKGVGKWMKGRRPAEETLQKISLSRQGHAVSIETRNKISAANAGEKNGMYGKTHTREVCKKISEAAREMWKNPDSAIHKYIGTPLQRENSRKGALAAVVPLQDTFIERKVRYFLESRQVVFEAHRVMSEIKHVYRCDFYIPAWNLVVECDGDYWYDFPRGREIDRIRTKELQAAGFNVLRLWEHVIRRMTEEKFFALVGATSVREEAEDVAV